MCKVGWWDMWQPGITLSRYNLGEGGCMRGKCLDRFTWTISHELHAPTQVRAQISSKEQRVETRCPTHHQRSAKKGLVVSSAPETLNRLLPRQPSCLTFVCLSLLAMHVIKKGHEMPYFHKWRQKLSRSILYVYSVAFGIEKRKLTP